MPRRVEPKGEGSAQGCRALSERPEAKRNYRQRLLALDRRGLGPEICTYLKRGDHVTYRVWMTFGFGVCVCGRERHILFLMCLVVGRDVGTFSERCR